MVNSPFIFFSNILKQSIKITITIIKKLNVTLLIPLVEFTNKAINMGQLRLHMVSSCMTGQFFQTTSFTFMCLLLGLL